MRDWVLGRIESAWTILLPWVLWSLTRVVFLAAEIISSDEGNPPLLLTHCNKTRDNGFPRCFFSSVHAATACFTGDAYTHEKLANLLAAAAAAIAITIATSYHSISPSDLPHFFWDWGNKQRPVSWALETLTLRYNWVAYNFWEPSWSMPSEDSSKMAFPI